MNALMAVSFVCASLIGSALMAWAGILAWTHVLRTMMMRYDLHEAVRRALREKFDREKAEKVLTDD